jgi:hypothetical protein
MKIRTFMRKPGKNYKKCRKAGKLFSFPDDAGVNFCIFILENMIDERVVSLRLVV